MFEPFGKLLKLFKYFAMDMGAMIATLGAFKLTLLAGQLVLKAWNISLYAMGAAAGAAVAALAGVLGAMRELQLAQLKPVLSQVYKGTGAESGAAVFSNIARDRRLGMFGAEAGNAVAAYAKAGQKVDANQLARLGDFAAGDPKAFASIAGAMAQAQKAGKLTGETYKEFQKTAPGLAAAFEELAGGAKNAENATISFDTFNKALQEGKLKALEPYNGALNEINNTLMGKFKGGLAVLKETLTQLGSTSYKELYGAKSPYSATTGQGTGMTMVDAAKKPLDALISSLQGSLNAIGPALLRVFPQMTAGIAEPLNKAFERLTYWIVEGVNKLDGLSGSLDGIIGKTRMVFSTMATYVTNAAAPFDSLWKNFVLPLGQGLASLLNGVVQHFGEVANDNAETFSNWGDSIKHVLENLNGFLQALAETKKLLAPIITVLLKMTQVFTKLFFGTNAGRLLVTFGLIVAALTKITYAFYKMKAAAVEAMGKLGKAAKDTADTTSDAAGGGGKGIGGAVNAIAEKLGFDSAGGLAVGSSLATGATILGGMITSRAKATDTEGQVIGGALSSAGVGAMMGAMAGPAGMAIGAAAGGVIGGVMSALNAKDARERKQEETKRNVTNALIGRDVSKIQSFRDEASAMAQARQIKAIAQRNRKLFYESGGEDKGLIPSARKRTRSGTADEIQAATQDLKRLEAEYRKNAKILKQYGGSETGAISGANEVLSGGKGRQAKLNANKAIGMLFGFDMEELGSYARRHNKSLAATALGIKDMIKLLGYSGKLRKGMATAGDLAKSADRLFQQLTDRASATKRVSQTGIDAVNRMTQFINEGKTGQSADQAAYNAADTMERIVARQTARLSAGMYGQGGYNLFASKTTEELKTFYEGAQRAGVTQENLNALLAQMLPIIAQLNDNSKILALRLQVDPQLAGMLENRVMNSAAAVVEGVKNGESAAQLLKDEAAKLMWFLGEQGITIDPGAELQIRSMLSNAVDAPEGAGKKIVKALNDGAAAVGREIRNAFGTAKLKFTIKINGKEQTIDVNGIKVGNEPAGPPAPEDDTATPRFARTMARHAALNGLVSGKRTITSGIRTDNLGSIGSDHRFGYAYDLVGQNLGAYATNVIRSGGFAEFHGTGGARHLHVVPGAGPVGDTASPIGPIGGGMMGLTTNNINIAVYAPEGSSPAAIADEVMVRIGRAQRDAVERR